MTSSSAAAALPSQPPLDQVPSPTHHVTVPP
eukprot:CAMPEP_0181235742 /NCGR_PEP_ID=MMETSP1096-20121128/37754_1 /TAXON_ID=156174 ORGANISM="Chrysochromulina ericina, Strain CCMP281" /NCGR_SAMPLE_ID=MMETSP1096 /ASSEMBLY_ACC=CAM_ASM_000453 /LENGTH=30 /DNA_ID= /DNA_START= /DNA_END= /DNA_ORIENTATION=